MYIFAMIFFYIIPVELPKPFIPKEKHQSLLHAIGGGWYTKQLSDKLTPLKKIKIRKKAQEKEDEIKRRLQKANQDWNDWKFQIY